MDATVPTPTAERTSRVAPSQPHPMNETMDKADIAFLSPARIAEMLSVCTMTVYRLIHRGALPAYRVARRLRVARLDVERYLARIRGPEAYAGA